MEEVALIQMTDAGGLEQGSVTVEVVRFWVYFEGRTKRIF